MKCRICNERPAESDIWRWHGRDYCHACAVVEAQDLIDDIKMPKGFIQIRVFATDDALVLNYVHKDGRYITVSIGL